jgi:hypothetical protein
VYSWRQLWARTLAPCTPTTRLRPYALLYAADTTVSRPCQTSIPGSLHGIMGLRSTVVPNFAAPDLLQQAKPAVNQRPQCSALSKTSAEGEHGQCSPYSAAHGRM